MPNKSPKELLNQIKSILTEIESRQGIKPFEKLKSVSEDNIQETSKELLKRYKEKADIQAKELDAEAKQGKNPIENLKKITKASKRGLGAFKAHLKLRKMEDK